jgi:hypothetical protein
MFIRLRRIPARVRIAAVRMTPSRRCLAPKAKRKQGTEAGHQYQTDDFEQVPETPEVAENPPVSLVDEDQRLEEVVDEHRHRGPLGEADQDVVERGVPLGADLSPEDAVADRSLEDHH